jgi:hypothetical protein
VVVYRADFFSNWMGPMSMSMSGMGMFDPASDMDALNVQDEVSGPRGQAMLTSVYGSYGQNHVVPSVSYEVTYANPPLPPANGYETIKITAAQPSQPYSSSVNFVAPSMQGPLGSGQMQAGTGWGYAQAQAQNPYGKSISSRIDN